ncbi:hypothetical protein ANO11243_047450 [Dothideomycetidae sp. 11243]|nr:hypothetical protein ANO11243_047450 [fungal sp. No.11243]
MPDSSEPDPPSPLPGITSLESATRFFTSHPWTESLVSAPGTNLHVPDSLSPKRTGEDSFMAESLPHPSRLTHCLALHARGPPEEDIRGCTVLHSLGDGLNGHPGILHGGMVCVFLDEGAGVCIGLYNERRHARLVAQGKASGEIPEPMNLYTTRLDTRFFKPVLTPGIVACKVQVLEVTERGIKLKAELRQWKSTGGRDGKAWGYGQGDGEEIVCASADIEFRSPRKGGRL